MLHREFDFTVDVCANEVNACLPRYFSEEDNGLIQPWEGERCYMNPPYGQDIPKWIAKAYWSAKNGATVVCLLPSRTDTGWWHDYVMRAEEVRFIRGRLKFEGAQYVSPFPCLVVVFRGGGGPPVISSIGRS